MSRSPKKKLKFKKPTSDEELEFMYYPDIEDENFYPHIWLKQEFYENRSLAREYYEDPKKKRALLRKICTPDVLKLKNHQIFLRNFLSPETPYNSILVYHGIGSGKCVLPDTSVYLNGSLINIEDIWDKYSLDQVEIDLDEGEWSHLKSVIRVNSHDQKTGKIIECPVGRLYRQKVSEKIRVIELEDGQILKLTKMHHLLTENGWSNDFSENQYVSVPKVLKSTNNEESIGEDLAYFLGWQISEGHERNDQYNLNITNNDLDILAKLKTSILNIAKLHHLNVNNPNILIPKDRSPYLQLYSKDYVMFLKRLGYEWGHLSRGKKIPSFMMTSTSDEKRIFLKAFFDAESSVCPKHKNIEISSASQDIIIGLQHLLKFFKINMVYKKTKKMATNGARILRDYYVGYIRSEGLREYNSEIGYSLNYKQKKLNQSCSVKLNPNKCKFQVNKIIKSIKSFTCFPNKVFVNKNIIYDSTEPSKATLLKIISNLEDIIDGNYNLLTKRDFRRYTFDNKFLQEKVKELKYNLNNEVELVKIEKILEEDYQGYVYDLEIETHHNYVANGILCHNTCAGVTIAEGLKEMVEKYNKKIYVIANTLLQGNFQSTLYNIGRERSSKYPGSLQCTKTTYYIPPKPKESKDMRKQREKAIREMQKKYYQYFGYIKFVHHVEREVINKGLDLGEFFNNSVFIIDEAHNLIAKSGTKSLIEERKKTRQKLHDIFKVAKNTKLIMLTATPITNEIDDILVLINLLRANDKRRRYKESELSTDGSSKLTRYNLDSAKFSQYVKGYISYFRGAHPSSFPLELPQSNYNRKLRADIFGDVLGSPLPNFKELSLITCEMSYFHFYNYFQNNMILERNSIGGTRSRDAQGDQLKIQAATAMYPLESAEDDRVGTYDITDVFVKEKSKGRVEKYKYRTKEKFLDISLGNEKYLHDDRVETEADNTIGYPLAKYSSKFYRMFYDIVNSFGINFIFTRYRTNVGTIPMSLMLEQNGYVRYHQNLGKPNEFTGKYREGVNNHLDIRGAKYRCICGYLDDVHNPRYSGKNDYRDPRKHRFLQGTYLRVDGETSDNFEIHRKELNSPANKYGQIIKVIVGGQNMREGVDLNFVRSVHIMNPWHNLIQIEQTIGRAIRLCSHAKLDSVDDMNVKVFKYVSTPPQKKLPAKWSLWKAIDNLVDEDRLDLRGVKFRDKSKWISNLKSGDVSDWTTVDEYIYARALNKDYNIKFAERLMKQAAIDCYLNLEANLTFPNQVDGSRVCDYTTCRYECAFPHKMKASQVNLDTYDLYFMEPKVQEAQEVIGDLFTRNWALTLDSVVDLSRRSESSLNRDIIYLALDRMLGDPPRVKPAPVVDKFGRYGYLIYRHPFYVYQPEEVMDESLPIYNREVPSKPSRREIDIKDLIKPKKKKILMKKPLRKTSPSDKLSIEAPTSQLKMTQNRFSSQIESFLAPIQNQDEITLAGVLDYLVKRQHEYLIRTRIEDICHRREITGLDKKIIFYYMENFLVGHTKMTYDDQDRIRAIPKNGDWVYNLAGHFWTYNCERKRWIEIHEDNDIMDALKDRQESRSGPAFLRIDLNLSPELYGYLFNDNKKQEVKFKITDVGGQQVKTKRYSEETNIKTLSRGQVCGNYSNEQLEKICDRLKIKYESNLQRNSLCSLIERELRVRDAASNQYLWFMNFYNFKRKFDKLESTDIRSLYNFYRG